MAVLRYGEHLMGADALGERVKRYEAVSRGLLTPNTPVFIRVDGRAFHTYTRRCNKPFDMDLVNAMVYAAQMTAAEMSGFVLGYVQSDEATFMLSDYTRPETQGWFGYETSKLVSLSASLFTAYFNERLGTHPNFGLATFDARAFNVPLDDAPNVFVWRQKDWGRNWVSMLARSQFSAKELHGKGTAEVLTMLAPGSVDAQPYVIKRGTFLFPGGELRHEHADYEQLKSWMGSYQK